MFQITTPPNILIETTSSYATQALQLLEQRLENSNYKRKLSVSIIPAWPHYFSGILQATGILIAEKFFSKPKIILVYTQNKFPKDILIQITDIWPFLWETRTQPDEIKKLSNKYSFVKKNKTNRGFIWDIQEIAPFVRVLSSYSSILAISVWAQTTLKNLHTFFQDPIISPNYNIIFVDNCNSWWTEKEIFKLDNILIWDILSKTNTTYLKKSFPLRYYFASYIKKHKLQAEAIAYTNSGTIWWDPKNTTGFACIVA